MKIYKSITKTVLFLGSALFAVLLLTLTGILVALGTFLESKTGSHLFAMESVYSSMLFRLLLTGFFINILLSALLRYPFKVRHIPFLITHMGLLMIILGLAVKNVFGLQGIIVAPAGSERDFAFIPERKELVVEIREGEQKERFSYELYKDFFGKWNLKLKKNLLYQEKKPPLDIHILGSVPHSKLVVDTFFKGHFVHIEGLRPLPAFSWKTGEELPLSGKIRMHQGEGGVFNVIALKTEEKDDAVRPLIHKALLSVYVYGRENPLFQKYLGDIVNREIQEGGYDFLFTLETSDQIPSLLKIRYRKEGEFYEAFLPLEKGEITKNPYLDKKGLLRKVDIQMEPTLLFIQDREKRVHIVGLDTTGKITTFSLGKQGEGGSLVSYDDGFSGYGVQIPFPSSLVQKDFEKSALLAVSEALHTCTDALSFSVLKSREHLALFMKTFSLEGGFIYEGLIPLSTRLQEALQKSSFFEERKELTKALFFTSLILHDVFSKDTRSFSLNAAFQKRDLSFLRRSPFLDEKDDSLFLSSLLKMVLTMEQEGALAEIPFSEEMSITQKATLLSVLLRLESLDFETFFHQKEEAHHLKNQPLLETRLSLEWKKESEEGVKAEELSPLFLLGITYKDKKEKIIVGMDFEGKGFTSSFLEGAGKLFLSPLTCEIPYYVRVQDAEEKKYLGTPQAEEYRCSLYLRDKILGESTLHHIGLNRVFETKEGYRFFLSSILPSDESRVQEVRFALNYDPSRRILIFMGSLFVALGILLLYFFVFRPCSKSKDSYAK